MAFAFGVRVYSDAQQKEPWKPFYDWEELRAYLNREAERKEMRPVHLKITITYFNGRREDVFHHYEISVESARQRIQDLLTSVQDCINERQVFYADAETSVLGIGPELLPQCRFSFEIFEGKTC